MWGRSSLKHGFPQTDVSGQPCLQERFLHGTPALHTNSSTPQVETVDFPGCKVLVPLSHPVLDGAVIKQPNI